MISGTKINYTFSAQGGAQLIGPNPRRVGLLLGIVSASTLFISLGDPAGNNDGLRINSGSWAPQLILFDSPNDWIAQPVNGWALAALSGTLYEFIDRQP